jgi:hypothetical protein
VIRHGYVHDMMILYARRHWIQRAFVMEIKGHGVSSAVGGLSNERERSSLVMNSEVISGGLVR